MKCGGRGLEAIGHGQTQKADAVNEWKNWVVLGVTEKVKASNLKVDRYCTLAKLVKVTTWNFSFAHNARGRS